MHQRSLHPSTFLWYWRCSDRLYEWQIISIVASSSQHLTAFLQLKSIIQNFPQNAVMASKWLHLVKAQILHQFAVIYWRNYLSLSLYDVSMICELITSSWRLENALLLHISLRTVPRYRYQSTGISVYQNISLLAVADHIVQHRGVSSLYLSVASIAFK
jgi:hypothetical protein